MKDEASYIKVTNTVREETIDSDTFLRRVEYDYSMPKKDEGKKTELEYPHSEFGEIEIKDIPRIKKISAKHLQNSWQTIPHVTNHDEADITEMESFRISLKDIYTGERQKITPLAFITKAVVSTMKKFPNFSK